jgi:hypothetical protein
MLHHATRKQGDPACPESRAGVPEDSRLPPPFRRALSQEIVRQGKSPSRALPELSSTPMPQVDGASILASLKPILMEL